MEESKTSLIAGTAGGTHVVDGPLTTAGINEASPSLLRNEIDSRIVRIRPMSTPVDQISRMIGARPSKSMVVEYYSVDTKPTNAAIAGEPEEMGYEFNGVPVVKIATDNNAIFAKSETVLVPDVPVQDSKKPGTEVPLMLYVVDNPTGDAPEVIAVNTADGTLPAMTSGTRLVRMGRAASELDVQTAQFGALPVKDFNYCQIFKTQIEQSLYAKISAKEVGWTFSDQEEVAVMDMRMGMEKNFLFGTKARLSNPSNYDDVLLTGGIWNQAGSSYALGSGDFTERSLVSLMRAAFTGDAAGSSRKVLIAGAGLIERLNCLSYVRNLSAADKVTHWGIDFTEVTSKFGSLFVIYSEIFDQCGHADDGLVIDPAYLAKYVHVPFRVDMIDMHKTGARNTQALVATEASCIVLRHPKAHVKITCNG